MAKKAAQPSTPERQRKGYASATQTITEVWQTLAAYSSPEKPLTVSEICAHMRKNDPKSAPSTATLNRKLPVQAEVLNTLHPDSVLCQDGLPGILHSYFSDHTLHVVLEDRLGKVLKEADCTVIVEPKETALPPSYSTVEKLLQRLLADGGALFPLRLKCVRLENTMLGPRYIPYTEWEDRYEDGEMARNNQARRYYLESVLSPAEWRIFSDLVQVYPYISERQTSKFLSVLEKFSPALKSRISSRYAFKRGNDQQFRHIAVLDAAIRGSHPVSLRYGEYRLENENGEWLPKLVEREKRGHLTLEPYALMWSNGYYYLVGRERKQGGMMNLRVDRILRVAALSEESFRRDAGFDPYVYRDRSPVMYPSVPQVIRLRCRVELVNTILDFFGAQARFSAPVEGMTEITLNLAPSGVKLFALQYMDSVEVLDPPSLREEVKQSLEAALRRYNR